MDSDAQKNYPDHEDAQCVSVLSSGKWLKIVKNSPKVSFSRSIRLLDSKIPRHLVSLDAKIDPLSNHTTINTSNERRKHKVVEEELVSCDFRSCQSEKMHNKLIALSRKTSLSQSTNISQGTLHFDTRDNETHRFVFKLENQKDIYVASLSSNEKEQGVYMIHLERRDSSSHLVCRIKVSTLYSSSSRIIERKFVLFSSINDEQPKILLPRRKKNRGLIKNTKSNSRLRCSWDDEQEFQEPRFENNFATNLERLAVIVKQEFIKEESGGWGLKFLRKFPRLDQTESESSRDLISMDVVMPSGIHGGPEDGPLSLVERWKSQGNCDCGGWDLGCSLTLLQGQCNNNILELFLEGSSKHDHETPGLRIVNVREGHYFVQFQRSISALQSLTIALALGSSIY